MYTIYHIPKIKIGCSAVLERRIKEQGFIEYEVLEEHTDIYLASDREITLQKKYGLPVDYIPYWQSVRDLQLRVTKESCSKGGKIGGKMQASILKTCPHCGFKGKSVGFLRWHGDNCKAKTN